MDINNMKLEEMINIVNANINSNDPDRKSLRETGLTKTLSAGVIKDDCMLEMMVFLPNGKWSLKSVYVKVDGQIEHTLRFEGKWQTWSRHVPAALAGRNVFHTVEDAVLAVNKKHPEARWLAFVGQTRYEQNNWPLPWFRNKSYVNGWSSELGEIEREFEDLSDAIAYAGAIIKNGGWANVTDDEGNEYPIF